MTLLYIADFPIIIQGALNESRTCEFCESVHDILLTVNMTGSECWRCCIDSLWVIYQKTTKGGVDKIQTRMWWCDSLRADIGGDAVG